MADNLFYEMLKEAREGKHLVCVFRDPSDLRRFTVGYVEALSEHDYTLQQIDPDGNPDGLDIGDLDDIIEIRRESRYARQMALLLENAEELAAKPEAGWTGNANPESCLEAALRQAVKDRLVVNIMLATGDDEVRFYGLVRGITESHVLLDVLTDDGEPDGTTVVRLDDIAGLQMNTHEERKVALYNKHRTHLYL